MFDLYRVEDPVEKKAYQDIVELIGKITDDEVWAMYCCASGLVRYEIQKAIREQIAQGNISLSKKFPELCP